MSWDAFGGDGWTVVVVLLAYVVGRECMHQWRRR
jgi:hypothetical protein